MPKQDNLVAHLAAFLMERNYAPSERLPSERELADRFRTSRAQIRETLTALETLRIVERRPKSGSYLAGEAPSVEALAFLSQIGVPLSESEVSQVVEIRHINEVEAIRLACHRRTENNLSLLHATIDHSATRIQNNEPIDEEDKAFHAELVRSTQNGVFFRLINIYYIMSAQSRHYYFTNSDRCRRSHREHQLMLAAVENRDADSATELMRQHLQGVHSSWKSMLNGNGGPEPR